MDVYTPTGAPTSTVPQGSTAGTSVNSDYETFLVMMTTQIQNQDPLDPMDANEFAVQLATFSSVEQQVMTNDLLTSMTASMNQSSMADMVDWIGAEVRIAAPVSYDGTTPITLSPNPAAAADGAVLVVTNAEGVEVGRQDIPVSTADYEWVPTDAEGLPLPEGLYVLTLESYAGEELLGTTEIEHYSIVQEVRSSPSGSTLLFEGGIEVPSVYVTALRPPSTVQ